MSNIHDYLKLRKITDKIYVRFQKKDRLYSQIFC